MQSTEITLEQVQRHLEIDPFFDEEPCWINTSVLLPQTCVECGNSSQASDDCSLWACPVCGRIQKVTVQISRTAEHYDYAHQAWLDANGKYLCCAHPEKMHCNCYGRIHYGEDAVCMCGKAERIYGCPVHGIRGSYYE